MKRRKDGYTPKQYAYAMRSLAPKKSRSKREMALAVGYSDNVAKNTLARIERTEGFENALGALASKTGNAALKILAEVNNRDLSKVPLAELMSSITTLAHAWETFTPQEKEPENKGSNPLRAIILEHVKVTDVTPERPIIESNQ